MAKIGRVVVVAGSRVGNTVEIPPGESVTIGRDVRCDLTIFDRDVSRLHCKITNQDGTFVLEDMQSRNGTRVNGRSYQKGPIEHDDVIQIGKTRLLFTITSDVPVAAAADSVKVLDLRKKTVEKKEPVSLEGQTLGDFRLISRLFEDYAVDVYKATQVSKNRLSLVNVLDPELAKDKEAREEFVNSCHLMAKVKSEWELQCYMGGVLHGHVTLATEFFGGQCLRDLLMKNKDLEPLEEKVATKITLQILGALHAAHKRGVVHGSLRPTTVLVDKDARVKIFGFGLPRIVTEKTKRPSSNVQKATYALSFQAPEQVQRPFRSTQASDVYSALLLYYVMLTGEIPFTGTTIAGVANEVRLRKVPPPRQFNPRISEEIAILLLRGLKKDPSQRFQTAIEAAKEIRAATGL